MTPQETKRHYNSILFDLDGTLIDSEECITASVQFALNQLDIYENDEDILRSFIGPPLRDSFKKYHSLNTSLLFKERVHCEPKCDNYVCNCLCSLSLYVFCIKYTFAISIVNRKLVFTIPLV